MKQIIGVSGHRPSKLGPSPQCYSQKMFDSLVLTFEDWLIRNPNTYYVYTGVARGFDQAVAQACINQFVPFWAAVPFQGQENKWLPKNQKYYKYLISKASNVVVVSEGSYSPAKLQVRNRFIVDTTQKLVVLWNGDEFGGTWNCVKYAKKVRLSIENLYHDWLEIVNAKNTMEM